MASASASTVEYRFDCQGLSRELLEEIFRSTNLGGRQDGKILKAFQQSADVCIAWSGEHLVGVSRLISDGVYHAFVYDVAVDPRYQKHGIGRKMMEHLIERNPVWRVMLRAAADVQGFYQRFDFCGYDDIMARIDHDFFNSK